MTVIFSSLFYSWYNLAYFSQIALMQLRRLFSARTVKKWRVVSQKGAVSLRA